MKKWVLLLSLLLSFSILDATIAERGQTEKINDSIKKSVIAIQDQDYEQALIFIQEAKDLDTKNAEIYQMEGQILEMLGKNEDAINAWENCLKYADSDSLKNEAEVHIKHLRNK